MNNSQLPGDHVSAGSYDTGMRVRSLSGVVAVVLLYRNVY